jgi:hypothetical protein
LAVHTIAIPAILPYGDRLCFEELKAAKEFIIFRDLGLLITDLDLNQSIENLKEPFPPFHVFHSSP